MQCILIMKLSFKIGFRLLISKKRWGISNEKVSEFWFLGVAALDYIFMS